MKAFALICILLIAAICVDQSDAAFWRRIRNFTISCGCSCKLSWPPCRCACTRSKRSAGVESATECLPVRMEVYDCNDDGKVSYHEMVVALMLDEEDPSSHEVFQKWDTNGDRFLSEEELKKDPWHLESPGCREKLHNHERQSLSGQFPGNFDVYDANNDGLIDKQEFRAVVEELYGEVPMDVFDNVMEKISRCDGEIDRPDFDLAVAVSAPWLFKMAEGEEGADQMAMENDIYEEIKDDVVGDGGTRGRRDADLPAQ